MQQDLLSDSSPFQVHQLSPLRHTHYTLCSLCVTLVPILCPPVVLPDALVRSSPSSPLAPFQVPVVFTPVMYSLVVMYVGFRVSLSNVDSLHVHLIACVNSQGLALRLPS